MCLTFRVITFFWVKVKLFRTIVVFVKENQCHRLKSLWQRTTRLCIFACIWMPACTCGASWHYVAIIVERRWHSHILILEAVLRMLVNTMEGNAHECIDKDTPASNHIVRLSVPQYIGEVVSVSLCAQQVVSKWNHHGFCYSNGNLDEIATYLRYLIVILQ